MTDFTPEELQGQMKNLTDHELLLLMAQSLTHMKTSMANIEGKLDGKTDKSEFQAYQARVDAHEKEIEKVATDAHHELETYRKEMTITLQQRDRDHDVKDKENSIELNKRFSQFGDRLTPLEGFRWVLWGMGAGFIANLGLTATLIVYIITKK